MKNTIWTTDKINLLLELHNQGLSTEQIGQQLGHARKTIRDNLRKLGATLHPRTYVSINDEETAKIVELYQSGLNQKEIASKLHRAPQTIRSILAKQGTINVKIYNSRHYCTNDNEQKIFSMYEDDYTIAEIAIITNLSHSSVQYHLQKSNLWTYKGTRKYTLNEAFFDQIDSEEKAYWLGMLAADGNVHKTIVHLGMHMNDRGHLEKFKIALNSEHPIRDTAYVSKGKCRHQSIFSLGSAYMAKSLIDKGLTPAKTKTLNWNSITNQIPAELLRHFVRGFFDGDGTWKNAGRGRIAFAIGCKSLDFISGLQKYLAGKCNLSINKLYNRTSYSEYGDFYVMEYGGRFQMQRIYDFLYDESSVWLERKKDKAFASVELNKNRLE